MNTRITGGVAASRLGLARIDRGKFDVQIARRRVDIARISVAGDGGVLTVHGYAGLAAGAASRVTYQLRGQDIAPVLKFAGYKGNGKLDLAGVMSGPPTALRLRGAARLEGLSIATYSVRRGDLRYDFTATGPAAPYGSGAAKLWGVSGAVSLKCLSANIRVAHGAAYSIALSLEAEDSAGRHDSFASNFLYRPGSIEGRVTQLALQLPTGEWRLGAPVDFRRDPRGVSLGRAQLHSAQSEFSAEGTLADSGEQNFQITMSGFDLATLQPLLPSYRRIAGTLSARASINGTAAAPEVYFTGDAKSLTVESQRVGNLSAMMRYQPQRTTIDAVLQRSPHEKLTLAGVIPATVEWANGLRARIGTGMDLRIRSAQLNLAQLGMLARPMVRDLRGTGAVDLTLRGSPSHPAPNGMLRVSDAKAKIVPLGVDISGMHATVEVTPQEVRLKSFEAQSSQGSLIGSGAIRLNAYAPGSGGLRLQFINWPAIDTPEYQATINGDIVADGSLAVPSVHGTLEVVKATIHPDLDFLSASSALAPDRTITVIPAGAKAPLPKHQLAPATMAAPAPPGPPTQSDLVYTNLTLNLLVEIPRDTWIRHEDGIAELEGRLKITKGPRAPIRISGTIRTLRGWVQYAERRFTLQTGQLEFTGGRKIDPNLNVDARYLVTKYTVDILIGGTASRPTIQLKSTPELPQTDILSLLLFGKTASALGRGQQADLQQQAARMAAGYAAETIGRAVTTSMGLQDLGVDLSGVSTSGGSLGVGRYVSSNTYVSASQTLGHTGTMPGGKASIQYIILPWLSITTSTYSDGSREIDLTLTKQY